MTAPAAGTTNIDHFSITYEGETVNVMFNVIGASPAVICSRGAGKQPE